MSDVELQQAIEIVRKLSPEEQAQLVAQVVTDLARKKTSDVPANGNPLPLINSDDENSEDGDNRTWGQKLVDMINAFDYDPTEGWDGKDPEEWVREHRRTQTSRRNPGWGDE